MLCNTYFKIRSKEGCEIDLLMPSENVIVDIQNDLGTQETIEVNLTTVELLECASFLTTGNIPKTNVNKFQENIKYLQCVNIIPDVPDTFNLIKMKEDWLRHNIPNELMKIDSYQGVYKFTSALYDEYPTCKLSVRKTLYAPKTKTDKLNINHSLTTFQTLLGTLGITNTKEKGVLVAGGSVFCSLYKLKISDYDLFFYGYDESEALTIINRIISSPNIQYVIRTAYAITFQLNHTWIEFQFILRLYQTIPQILLGFDLDCSRIGCDGQDIWITESALFSLKNSVNIVDFDRMGRSYEYRLAKYAKRNIAVYVPQLEYSKIRYENIPTIANKNRYSQYDKILPNQIYSFKLVGLSRLIYLINTLTEKQKDNTYGPSIVPSEVVPNKNVDDVIEFFQGYTAIVRDITADDTEYYETFDHRAMHRILDSKSRKAISVWISGNMTIDYLTAFCSDTVFPRQIEFKKINPGE